MSGFNNPYMNPYGMNGYGQIPQAQVMPQIQRQVEKVNGRNGALQYPMGPNCQAWILDENGEISWLIITDSAGYKTATPYDVKPHEDAPVPDFGSLETRITKLEEIINGNSNSANPTAIRKKTNSIRSDDCTD